MSIWDRSLNYEAKINGNTSVYITSDKGFEPFLDICNILTNEYGLKLTNQIGITDMQAFLNLESMK